MLVRAQNSEMACFHFGARKIDSIIFSHTPKYIVVVVLGIKQTIFELVSMPEVGHRPHGKTFSH